MIINKYKNIRIILKKKLYYSINDRSAVDKYKYYEQIIESVVEITFHEIILYSIYYHTRSLFNRDFYSTSSEFQIPIVESCLVRYVY